ncbi:MAG: DUF3006 domain-containing protein [Clostridia bacterium]|nr:DUF3006 domain-containing protein [Clostridia bacterium]
MKYIIDRFESEIAVCEDEQQNFITIPKTELPSGCIEGSKIESQEGTYILLDNSEDRERIKKKMNALFKD